MNGLGEKGQAWTVSGVGEEGTDQGAGDSWEWEVWEGEVKQKPGHKYLK